MKDRNYLPPPKILPPTHIVPVFDPAEESLEIRVHALETELHNEHIDDSARITKRFRVHMLWLGIGATLSVVLLRYGQDIGSCATTGTAPLVAEFHVFIRRW